MKLVATIKMLTAATSFLRVYKSAIAEHRACAPVQVEPPPGRAPPGLRAP
ncbi:MAG: hypothetical protein ABSF08_03235 [Candidatus Cybelea sp.]|jgi:hypothetical protein